MSCVTNPPPEMNTPGGVERLQAPKATPAEQAQIDDELSAMSARVQDEGLRQLLKGRQVEDAAAKELAKINDQLSSGQYSDVDNAIAQEAEQLSPFPAGPPDEAPWGCEGEVDPVERCRAVFHGHKGPFENILSEPTKAAELKAIFPGVQDEGLRQLLKGLQAEAAAKELAKINDQLSAGQYSDVDNAIAQEAEQLSPFPVGTPDEAPWGCEGEVNPVERCRAVFHGHRGPFENILLEPTKAAELRAIFPGVQDEELRGLLQRLHDEETLKETSQEQREVLKGHIPREVHGYADCSTASTMDLTVGSTYDDRTRDRHCGEFDKTVAHPRHLHGDINFEGRDFYKMFTLGSKITQGASGKVYMAKRKKPSGRQGRDEGEPNQYAVKRALKYVEKNGRETKDGILVHQKRETPCSSIAYEAHLLHTLAHPNVVKVHHFFRDHSRYYFLVMDFVAGGELFDHIGKKQTYSEMQARDVCAALVDVIGFLHDKNVVHRDLNPGSILLDSPEEKDSATSNPTTAAITKAARVNSNIASCLKLTDFGMARIVGDCRVVSTREKSEFKAPEMLLGDPHGKPVDMWSFGCLAYILLSGRHPFLERDVDDTRRRVVAGDFQFRQGWNNITNIAKDFVQQLLTVDTDRRLTAEQATNHPWLLAPAQSLEANDLHENLEQFRVSSTKRKLRAMLMTKVAARRVEKETASVKSTDFLGSYTLGKELGGGTFGRVFKATRSSERSAAASATAIPRCVAVKRIAKRGIDEEHKEAVVNEAKIMRRLSHENVLRIYDFYELDADFYYIVVELVHGGELFHRVEAKDHYNEAEARDICVILLRTVQYIHSQDIVHCDLSPRNLLLASPTEDTNMKLADFGSASSVRDGNLMGLCGTPAYMAPEMWKLDQYGKSVDMWSVGVIIYLLLVGYPPFHNRCQDKMVRNIKKGEFLLDDEFWEEVSGEAKDLVKKLLTVEPKDRLTASEACEHQWFHAEGRELSPHSLRGGLENLKVFNAKRKFRAAVDSVMVAEKFRSMIGIPHKCIAEFEHS